MCDSFGEELWSQISIVFSTCAAFVTGLVDSFIWRPWDVCPCAQKGGKPESKLRPSRLRTAHESIICKYRYSVHAVHVSYSSARTLKPKATLSASQPSTALHALSPPLRALCDPSTLLMVRMWLIEWIEVRMWRSGPLQECFSRRDGIYQNRENENSRSRDLDSGKWASRW